MGLRVPEGVAVVARARQPFGGDRPLLGPGARLQRLKEAEADRLLQFVIAVDLDVRPGPEVVEVLALGLLEPLEPLGERRLQASVDLVAEPLHRLLRRPVVGEELDDAQRVAGGQRGGEREPAEVRLALDERFDLVRRVDHVLHSSGQREATLPGGMREHDAHPVMRVQAALEDRAEACAAPGVAGRHDVALVGEQVRLQGDAQRRVQRLDLVADRGHAAVTEGDQPAAGHAHRASADRTPQELPLEDARAQIQRPLVTLEAPAVHVERLVLHEQPDRRAVGHADDRLSGLGKAERELWVLDRVRLEEAVKVGAAQAGRLALVERPPDAEVAVGQRKDRFARGQKVEVQPLLSDDPRFHREGIECDHAAVLSASRAAQTPGPANAGIGVRRSRRRTVS